MTSTNSLQVPASDNFPLADTTAIEEQTTPGQDISVTTNVDTDIPILELFVPHGGWPFPPPTITPNYAPFPTSFPNFYPMPHPMALPPMPMSGPFHPSEASVHFLLGRLYEKEGLQGQSSQAPSVDVPYSHVLQAAAPDAASSPPPPVTSHTPSPPQTPPPPATTLSLAAPGWADAYADRLRYWALHEAARPRFAVFDNTGEPVGWTLALVCFIERHAPINNTTLDTPCTPSSQCAHVEKFMVANARVLCNGVAVVTGNMERLRLVCDAYPRENLSENELYSTSEALRFTDFFSLAGPYEAFLHWYIDVGLRDSDIYDLCKDWAPTVRYKKRTGIQMPRPASLSDP